MEPQRVVLLNSELLYKPVHIIAVTILATNAAIAFNGTVCLLNNENGVHYLLRLVIVGDAGLQEATNEAESSAELRSRQLPAEPSKNSRHRMGKNMLNTHAENIPHRAPNTGAKKIRAQKPTMATIPTQTFAVRFSDIKYRLTV